MHSQDFQRPSKRPRLSEPPQTPRSRGVTYTPVSGGRSEQLSRSFNNSQPASPAFSDRSVVIPAEKARAMLQQHSSSSLPQSDSGDHSVVDSLKHKDISVSRTGGAGNNSSSSDSVMQQNVKQETLEDDSDIQFVEVGGPAKTEPGTEQYPSGGATEDSAQSYPGNPPPPCTQKYKEH